MAACSSFRMRAGEMLFQTAVFGFQFAHELYQLPSLVSKHGEFCNFFSTHKGLDVVDVVSGPFR